MRRLVLLAGTAAVSFCVVACGSPSTVTGQATTGSSAAATTAGGGSSTPTTGDSSGGGSSALPVNQPCSLLSSSDLSQLGLASPPSADQVGSASTCELSAPDAAIGVGIRTNEGLSALSNTGSVTNLTIGRHQAGQQVNQASGSCIVVLGVSASSRVDVAVNANDDSQACPDAMKVAQLVEPHLPAAG